MHRSLCLQREISRAVRCQQDGHEDGDGYRVPIEQSHIAARSEIGEKRHREISLGIEWNTTLQIACRYTEKNGEEKIGKDKNKIPVFLPKSIVDMAANLEGNATQNESPQNQHEREVIARERRGHQTWKNREQRAAKPDQPDFMPRPQRTDRRYHLTPLLRRFGYETMEHASAEIAPVQGH